MDDKDFKKHLQDLVHGHHHPEEHDWGPEASVKKSSQPAKRKRNVKKATRRSK